MYTRNFNMRTNEKERKEWKERAAEKNVDLSTYLRELIKEDIEKTKSENK